MSRLPALLVTLALAGALSGCKNPCVSLAERICECQQTTSLREDCNRRASDEGSRVKVTPEDEATCARLVKDCNCHALDTPEGKVACGLAKQWGVAGADAGAQ